MSSRRLVAAAFALVLSASSQAFAQGIPNFYSARAVSIGGARSLASGTEGIFLNPGALGFMQQYIIELDYAHDTAPSKVLQSGDGVVVSLVDSKTNQKLPTGLSVRYVALNVNGKPQQGAVYDMAIAAKLLQNMALGLHLSYLSYSANPNNVQNITGDLGLLIPIGPFSFNAVGFNLIEANTPDAPRGFDVGAAAGDGKVFRVGFDFSRQWPIHKLPENNFNLGGEVLIANIVPIRLGLLWNSATPKLVVPQYVTGGFGVYFKIVGFDASYRRNLATAEGSWAFSVKLFM